MSPTELAILDWLKPVVVGVLSAGLTAFGTWWRLRAQMRDQLERDLRMLVANFAESHASTVAFDRYVEFCEKYAEAMRDAVDALATEGPNRRAMQAADAMHRVRRNWMLWVPRDVATRLFKFEKKIRSIGVDAAYTQDAVGAPGVADIPDRINRMYRDLAEVLGLTDMPGGADSDEHAFETLAAWLQDTLGIEVAHALRRASGASAYSGERDRRFRSIVTGCTA